MFENNQSNQFPDYSGTNSSYGGTYRYEQPAAPVAQKKKGGTGRKIALSILCGLLIGVFAGLGFEAVHKVSDAVIGEEAVQAPVLQQAEVKTENKAEKPKETAAAIEKTAADTAAKTETDAPEMQAIVTDVTEVVKAVMPAVVSVGNKSVETMSFWGQQYSSENYSVASGIIVGQNETELLLVTNNHVVEGAKELVVQFVNGKQLGAEIKGTDADKDLAVISVLLSDIDRTTMEAIATAKLGDSDTLAVGEPVIAIGNALGYGQSVTTGVVSALHRAIGVTEDIFGTRNLTEKQDDKEINTFIQTDAAINFGNSGGALLNNRGEVIGINSDKIGGSAVEGMGYAIPISDAKPIIEDLMSKETKRKVDESKKGYLGITGVDVAGEYSELYGIPQGIYISSVSEGSGADKAGLRKGDIITGLNGKKVLSMTELKEELSYYSAGTTVTLSIMQLGEEDYESREVEVTLGKSVS